MNYCHEALDKSMQHQDDERVILALSFLEPLVLNKENIEIAV